MYTTTNGGEQNIRRATALSLMASLLFGSQFVVIKQGIGDLNPLFFGAMTSAIGGLIALIYSLRRGRFSISAFRHWEVWASAISSTALVSLQYVGLTMSPASIGGLIVGSNMIFVTPISALIFKERLGTSRALGVVIGLLGVFTISTGWDASSLSSSNMIGNLMLMGASLCIAISYPMNRLATRKMCFEEWVTGFHLLIPLFLLPMALVNGNIGNASDETLSAILFVGMLCTSVPTLLWAKGLQSLTFVTSATILMSESVFAVLLAVLILGESLTIFTASGAIMVFAAIFLVSYRGKSGIRRM